MKSGLVRGFLSVGLWTLISRASGFVRDILMAAWLGTGAVAEAFLIALSLPNMFRRFFAEGAFNTMILSLLYKLTPDECRLIMIDPKMLELSVYDGIPHLLSPVVTDPKKAVVALKWVVGEMEDRYRKMSKMGVRNIEGYNGRVTEALKKGEMFKRTVQTGFDDDTGDAI